MKKILCCDVETTGLDSNKNSIVQLALLMDIDNEVVDSLLLNMQPFDEDIVSSDLNGGPEYVFNDLKLNVDTMGDMRLPASGIKVSQLLTFMDPRDAYNKLTTFLDKYINKYEKADKVNKKAWFLGYNAQFDLNFMKRFFLKNNDIYLGSYIKWRILDPIYLLYNQDYLVEVDKRLPSMKLKDVCVHYEIEHIPHDPMSDITATRKLWYKLMRLNDAGGQ